MPKRKKEEDSEKTKPVKKSTVKRPFIDGVIPTSIIELARGKGDRRKHSDGVANWMHSSRSTYSHFPPEAVALSYDLYLRDRVLVWDGTAGWGERHGGALDRGRTYVGYDISPKAIENALDVYGGYNNLGNTLEMPVIPFDAYFSCVPYWNLEKYEMDEGMDHCKTWEEFIHQYRIMFTKAVEAAVPGARFVVMVGDWRKNHVYYDLTYQTQKIFTDLGLKCFDMSILSHRTSMNAASHIPQSVRLGYTAKVHETVLVYDKPGVWEYQKLKLNTPIFKKVEPEPDNSECQTELPVAENLEQENREVDPEKTVCKEEKTHHQIPQTAALEVSKDQTKTIEESSKVQTKEVKTSVQLTPQTDISPPPVPVIATEDQTPNQANDQEKSCKTAKEIICPW